MKTHTRSVPSTSKTFSHAVQGWPEGQPVMGHGKGPAVPYPSRSSTLLHLLRPCDPGPPPPPHYFQGRKWLNNAADQRQGTKPRAQRWCLAGPGRRPWRPTPTVHPPSQLVSLEAWPCSGLSPYRLAIPVNLQRANESSHF